MYKYILLDIDDTLLDFGKAEHQSIIGTFQQFGIDPTDENIERYSAINLSYWKRFERKEITKDLLWSGRFMQLGDEIGRPISEEEAIRINAHYLFLLGNAAFPIDGSEEFLRTLISRGYHLYAITNGNAKVQHTRLDALSYKQYFEQLFISEEVGFSKPDKEYFIHVMDEIGCHSSSKYLVIGDSLTSDIAGGNGVQIDTCWYNFRRKENSTGIQPTYTVDSYTDILKLLE